MSVLLCVILSKEIWQLLAPKMAISKLSGNTVKIKPNYLPNPFDFWHISLQNRSNWLKIQVVTSISYNLTPRLRKLVILEVLSSKKRFSTASSKFPSASFVGHQKLPEIGSKIRQVSYFKQRACNPKSQIPTIFSTFFKSQKWSAQNKAIFGGQNQKTAKKIFKNFYCPKSSEISYWSIIYL